MSHSDSYVLTTSLCSCLAKISSVLCLNPCCVASVLLKWFPGLSQPSARFKSQKICKGPSPEKTCGIMLERWQGWKWVGQCVGVHGWSINGKLSKHCQTIKAYDDLYTQSVLGNKVKVTRYYSRTHRIVSLLTAHKGTTVHKAIFIKKICICILVCHRLDTWQCNTQYLDLWHTNIYLTAYREAWRVETRGEKWHGRLHDAAPVYCRACLRTWLCHVCAAVPMLE